MKKLVKKLLNNLGYDTFRMNISTDVIKPNYHDVRNIYIMKKNLGELSSEHYSFLAKSNSQIGQDLFVASYLNFKKGGFFVDFGATDGIEKNNSCLLEKELGWTGILSEPARVWHKRLKSNRSAIIDTRCVWSTTGERLKFLEADDPEISTIGQFEDSDAHKSDRKSSGEYLVETISLMDLLEGHKAPTEIDFLSIDTEGSEYEILQGFDFNKYKIEVIACEHNHTDKREKIHDLLSSNGYQRLMEEVSLFDDWYVLKK